MYCGDTVPSIVAEVGTKWSKFGFSGEDKPSLVFHTVCLPGGVASLAPWCVLLDGAGCGVWLGCVPPQGVLSEVEAKQDDAGDGDVEMASSPASGPVADEAADSRTKVAAKVRG